MSNVAHGDPVMTTFVEIRPKTDGFVPQAEAELVPAARRLGQKVGGAVGEGAATGQRATRAELAKTRMEMVETGRAAETMHRHLSAMNVGAGFVGYEVAKKAVEGIRTAIQYADDLESTLARNTRLFGENSKSVDKFAQGAARSLGLSRGEADAMAGAFGTLATRLGVSQDKAAGMSVTLTKVAAQLAASRGGTAQAAGDAIQTALTGRGVALRRYGVVLDETMVKEEAHREGLIASTKDALSPATKALATYGLIMQKTGDITDYYAKHQDLTNEKLQTAHKEALNASESLGVALQPAMKALASLTSNDLNPALEGAGKALEALSEHRAARDTVVALTGVIGAAALAYKGLKLYDNVKKLSIFNHGAEVAARTATTAAIVAEGRAAAVAAGEVEALNLAERGAGLSAAERAAAAGTRFGTAVGAGVVGLARGSVITAATLAAYGITTEGLLRGDEQKTLREGAIARGRSVAFGPFDGRSFYEDLGHRLGSKTLDRWSGYTADKAAADAAMQAETRRLLEQHAAGHYDAPGGIVLTPGRQAAFNRAGVTEANLKAANANLARLRTYYASPDNRAKEEAVVSGVFGGSFDQLPDTTVGDPTKASAAAATAADRVRAAEERLRLAQLRLVDTRKRRHVTVSALASATSSVASAQRAVQTAEGKQTAADKAAAAAGATTALSAADLLKRMTGNLTHARDLAASSKKLVAEGISKPVLEELDKLEKDAPGTLHRLAGELTPAMIKTLNAQQTALDRAEQQFADAPGQALLKAMKGVRDPLARAAAVAGKAAGQAYAAGVVDGLGPIAPLFLPGGVSGGVPRPAAPSPTTPGGYTPVQPVNPDRPSAGNPRGDGTTHGVVIQVPAHHAAQVRHIAATAIARHDAETGRMVAGLI